MPSYVQPTSGLLGDPARDDYLTDFGKATLTDRYLFTGETYQDLFVRVASAYADDPEHAQRLYDYMSHGWFMPATPILSNGGTDRGLPISCFLNAVPDSLDGIEATWSENVWLAAKGGGIGTYWGDVREIGDEVHGVGQTSGIIPFIKVQDSLTLAISQGSLRRGSAAVYLDIHHPEIEEFIKIRKPTGDLNRKCLNIHQGVVITDEFMEAVVSGAKFDLIGPRHGNVVKTIDARELFAAILEMRLEFGEPYMLFIDTVNRALPEVYKLNNLSVRQSNLCSEIMLHTGPDNQGFDRTAVCCLSSVNVERYAEWVKVPSFIEDIMRFLDNVLQDFIDRTTGLHGFEKARYSAIQERSVGLGAMGWHSFLQKNMIPFESVMAKVWNEKIFSYLRAQADEASKTIASEKGSCPDAIRVGLLERFSHKLAIAPTSSISIICGGHPSPGVEPWFANIMTQKTLSGSFTVKNSHLEALLESKGINDGATWLSIIEHEGSVQHLEALDDHEKAVFKTFIEIDQRWVIDLASGRAKSIDQGQSVNIALPSDVNKNELLQIHVRGWRSGTKSLYYLRSLALSRAENLSTAATSGHDVPVIEECLACQ